MIKDQINHFKFLVFTSNPLSFVTYNQHLAHNLQTWVCRPNVAHEDVLADLHDLLTRNFDKHLSQNVTFHAHSIKINVWQASAQVMA